MNATDIYRMAETLKLPERRIMDFSNPSNPLGVSKKVKAELRKHLKYLHNYPDPECLRLRKRLGQYLATDPEMILCGNGSAELIHLLLRAIKPAGAMISLPAHPKYEHACRVCGIECTFFNAYDDGYKQIHDSGLKSSLIFLSNPNYPSGRLLKKDRIIELADAAMQRDCHLITDEAFMDFCPDESVIQHVKDFRNLIVLRTFSYFYSLAGLRLAYAILNTDIINKAKQYATEYPVNNLAQRAAVIAIKDRIYQKESLLLLEKEKAFLEKAFKKLGLDFMPSSANYYLVNADSADEIFKFLMQRGILLGLCNEYKSPENKYLKIAVKSHKENAVLIKELRKFLKR